MSSKYPLAMLDSNRRSMAPGTTVLLWACISLLAGLNSQVVGQETAGGKGNAEKLKPGLLKRLLQSDLPIRSASASIRSEVRERPESDVRFAFDKTLANLSRQSGEHVPVPDPTAMAEADGAVVEPAISPEFESDVSSAGQAPCQIIDGRDIACRTAAQWIPSSILRQRGRTLVQLFCDEDACQRQAAQSLYHFLDMQAKHQEDIGAASALRAYYTRIALEEQLQLTMKSLALLDSEEAKQVAAIANGLPAGTDMTDFERRRIALMDKQLQIASKDRQLRCLLAQLADADYAMSDVCQEELEIFQAQIDCGRVKQIALALRQDLKGWRYLASQVNEESAPIFAQMLGTIVGGWGLPLPRIVGLKNILCPPDNSCLVVNMRHELQLTVETHRRWICQAVEEKCANLEMAYERIQLAQETIASWEHRILQLEKLDQSGDGKPAELATARGEYLMAVGEDINRRLDARIAEIDLAEATGGISVRCCQGQAWLVTGYE